MKSIKQSEKPLSSKLRIKKRKEAVDTKNDADAMVFQTEKAMEEAGDKLDANDKTAVEADLNALKEILNGCANTDEITDAQIADIKASGAPVSLSFSIIIRMERGSPFFLFSTLEPYHFIPAI